MRASLARIRRHLTAARVFGLAVVVGLIGVNVTNALLDTGGILQAVVLGVLMLPVAVGFSWLDIMNVDRESEAFDGYFIAVSLAIVVILLPSAPLRALGGSLFTLVPILLSLGAVVVVIGAIPLYLLGAAGANAELT